ncbi:MAG: sugar phosphate nucleotidyltransferase [Actinomycetota bacterium]|nr:sugar phosphate nucleotidyltransferase [Actinomycetota bacterium]
MRIEVVAFVLSGGKGERLLPLTKDRVKPAMPFGGSYRVIDFVLSNLIHSRIRKIYILTQYEPRSLEKHIFEGWTPIFGIGRYSFIRMLPPKQGSDSDWYRGTADAVNQNKSYAWENNPDIIDIFSADHIYIMDISIMNDFHIEKNADLTISALPVKRETASKKYGVLVVDKNWKLIGFEEKPENPTPMPGSKDYCLASMGNYAFNPQVLIEELVIDQHKETQRDKSKIAENPDKYSSHDFGFDVIPAMLKRGRKIYVYNFNDNYIISTDKHEKSYWRDIGDLDEFYQANMDLLKGKKEINLQNERWEIFTRASCLRSPSISGKSLIANSIISNGCVVDKSEINNSILSYRVKVLGNTSINDSFLMGYNNIGKNVRIRNAIIDTFTYIPDNTRIGFDREEDLKRKLTISKNGVVIVPRRFKF